MQLVDAVWWNIKTRFIKGFNPCVGAVAIRLEDGEHWKAYIGLGMGEEERFDGALVMNNGVPLGRRIALAAFPHLDPDMFVD